MFNKSYVASLLKYFVNPYLGYKNPSNSFLLRKWPFFIERSRKQRVTYARYGTVFNNSHWTQSSIFLIKEGFLQPSLPITEVFNSLLPRLFTLPSFISWFIYPRGSQFISVLVTAVCLKFCAYWLLNLTTNLSSIVFDPDTTYELILLWQGLLEHTQAFILLLGYLVYGLSTSSIKTYSVKREFIHSIFNQQLVGTHNNKTTGYTNLLLHTTLKRVTYYTTLLSLRYSNIAPNTYSIEIFTVTTPCIKGLAAQTLSFTNSLASFKLILSSYPLLTFPQTTKPLLLRWVSYWDEAFTNNSLLKITNTVQESRWLLSNFPTSNNLYASTKKFTNTKLHVGQSDTSPQNTYGYFQLQFTPSNVDYKALALSKIQSTLRTSHLNFFESSRFFIDIRFYNLLNLKKLILGLFPQQQISQPSELTLTPTTFNTTRTKPLLIEPYIPCSRTQSKILAKIDLENDLISGVGSQSSYFHSRTDLLFFEFINSTLSPNTFPVNSTIPSNLEDIQSLKSGFYTKK